MKKLDESMRSVTLTPQSVVMTVAILVGIYFVYYIRQIVMMLFLALIVMSALNPALKWLERRLKLPKILAIFLLYISILFVIGAAILVIVPPLVAEIPNLINTLNLPPLPNGIDGWHFSVGEISNLLNQFRTSFDAALRVVSSAFNGIFSFFAVLVMACYLLIDRENLHKKVMWFTRDSHYLKLAKELVDLVEMHLGGWVRGQLFLMVTIGLITYIGLTLMSIPYALPLAIAAGLLEILPNLGPTLAAIPAVIIAGTMFGVPVAGFVALFYVVVQSLENNIIVPKIMKDSVDVNPLTTILSILIGAKIAGGVGALLAVPLYIVLRSVYSIWLREKHNERNS